MPLQIEISHNGMKSNEAISIKGDYAHIQCNALKSIPEAGFLKFFFFVCIELGRIVRVPINYNVEDSLHKHGLFLLLGFFFVKDWSIIGIL